MIENQILEKLSGGKRRTAMIKEAIIKLSKKEDLTRGSRGSP